MYVLTHNIFNIYIYIYISFKDISFKDISIKNYPLKIYHFMIYFSKPCVFEETSSKMKKAITGKTDFSKMIVISSWR